jgi:PAS domain S-box-containing protein
VDYDYAVLSCVGSTPSLLYFLSGITLFGLAVYLSRYGARSSAIVWLRSFFFLGAAFNIASSMLGCSPDAAFFKNVVNLYAATNSLLPFTLLIFVLHFVNSERILDSLWARAGIILSILLPLYFYWNTDIFFIHDIGRATTAFGNLTLATGDQYQALGGFLLASYVLPMVLLFRHARRIDDPVRKKEVRIVTIAISIFVVPATIVQGVLPAVFHVPTFPLTPFTSILTAVILSYAIVKYGVHVFNLTNFSTNLLKVLPGGLIVLDHTGTIQYTNQGGAQILGYGSDALSGLSMRHLFSSDAAYEEFRSSILAQTRLDTDVVSREVEFTSKDGAKVSVSVNVANVYSGKDISNQMVSYTDITHLKKVESALHREKASVERKVIERTSELRTSIGSLPFGFAIFDRLGNSAFSNERFDALVSHDASIAESQLKTSLVSFGAMASPVVDIEKCIASTCATRRPIEKKVVVGARFYRFYFAPVIEDAAHDTKVLGTIVLIEDTTEARSVERSRDEFFSIASHELRTPLTAIRGNVGMILDNFPVVKQDQMLNEMLEDTHNASVRLINIVNDFLSASRLEMGKMTFENKTVAVEKLVRDTLRQYDVTSSRRKLHLDVIPYESEDLWVHVDPDRFRQILINLVGNALKFTDKGGVTISFEKSDSRVLVRVADTGRGIPLKSQHLLFHKFQQASNNILTRDNNQSTGLGLYISRLMASGMSGKLYLEKSVPDEGSVFVLELASSSAPSDKQA